MNYVFVTSGLDFNGSDIDTKSLGGSETAMAYVARELAKRGNTVHVYCNCTRTGVFEGVRYEDNKQFGLQCQNLTIDVLIVSRFGDYWKTGITGVTNAFWLHDMPGDKADLIPFALKCDTVFALSDFHIDQLVNGAKAKELLPVLSKTSNGVDMDVVEAARFKKHPQPRFLYTSLPERGLIHLLQRVWPKIREQLPTATLAVAGYDIKSIAPLIDPSVRNIREQCNHLIKTLPGVIPLGPLNKFDLYGEMKSATALLYPCVWPEVFCITAIEAQACGCPIVTTDKFALSEVVSPENGTLVQGTGEQYLANFTEAAIAIAKDDARRSTIRETGPAWVRSKGYEWKTVARKWDEMFTEAVDKRLSQHPNRMISAMFRRGDSLTAEYAAEVLPTTEEIVTPALSLLCRKMPQAKIMDDVDKDVIYRIAADLWIHQRPGQKAPKRILDMGDDPGGFVKYCMKPGIVADVWVRPGEPLPFEPCEGATIRAVNGVLTDQYDLIFIGSAISNSQSAKDLIQKVRRDLSDDGLIVSSTPVGRIAFNDDTAARQRFSFDGNDLSSLLGDANNFITTFAKLFISERDETQGFWISTLGKEGKIGRPELRERMRRFRPEQTLSVAMIARDEEKWITMSLAEVKAIADEIVVVDTGSTDRTVEFAKFQGADVYHHEFKDFADARNFSRDKIRGDWFLWIDCDERLVGANKVRSYLDCKIPNAFAIAQNHLIVDGNRDADYPNRLVRNKPEYRFNGFIHEHCEDISDPMVFGKPIEPCYHTADLNIAHYGYVHEPLRRRKCLLRNMDLLIRDCDVNLPKGRMLTWVLAIRDYLNAMKWYAQTYKTIEIEPNGFEHKLLNAVVDTYHTIFRFRTEVYEANARQMYQEALQLLGANRLPYMGTGQIPFQISLFLKGDNELMPQSETAKHKAQIFWFCHPDEVREFMEVQNRELSQKMFAGHKTEQPPYKWDFSPGCPNPVGLLSEIRDKYRRG